MSEETEDKVLDAMINAYIVLENKANEQMDDINKDIDFLRKNGIKFEGLGVDVLENDEQKNNRK